MSDDEEVMSEEEEEEEEEEEPPKRTSAPASSAKVVHQNVDHLDEASKELLEHNSVEFEKLEAEILELRDRTIKRKAEREEEEKRLRKERDEEEKRRIEEEKDRKRKKEEEELERKQKRAEKMAEFEKMKNPTTPNFVISKKKAVEEKPVEGEGDENTAAKEKISREQATAEKAAILANRLKTYDLSETDASKLTDMAKAIHKDIVRGEGEKYDLEKRFKEQQIDMQELAEKARSMNKVGKAGTLKRIQLAPDEVDKIQERFAGAPAKIEMYSKFERQQDKRIFGEKANVFTGSTWAPVTERITAKKTIAWNENSGQPSYIPLPGFEAEFEAEEEE